MPSSKERKAQQQRERRQKAREAPNIRSEAPKPRGIKTITSNEAPRGEAPRKVKPLGEAPIEAPKQRWEDGELRPVRCWHCGSWHETVQACRDCPNETELGRWCANYGKSAWAMRPDDPHYVANAARRAANARGRMQRMTP